MPRLKIPQIFNLIGTSTSPVTLTAVSTETSKNFEASQVERFLFMVNYIPNALGVANSYIKIFFEVSNDGVTYFPYSSLSVGTSEIDVFNTPFVVPGNKTTTPGLAVPAAFWLDNIPAKYWRVSAAEIATDSVHFGTLFIAMSLLESI